MSRLHQAAIKEIAREVAKGNTCYIDKYTKKITTIDTSTEDVKVIEAQDQAIIEIEKKIENYLKIEKLSTEDQLEVMEYFLEEIQDKSVRKEMSNALKRKNPVRNFNQIIDSNMELIQQWRIFKFEEYQRWVSNFIIDAYNY
jgi:hypothetical protein